MKIRVIFLTILLIAFKSSAYSSNNSPFKNLVILTDPKEYKEIIFKDINGNNLSVAIIPHTLNNTTLKYKEVDDYLNLETDVFAKYVENIITAKN